MVKLYEHVLAAAAEAIGNSYIGRIPSGGLERYVRQEVDLNSDGEASRYEVLVGLPPLIARQYWSEKWPAVLWPNAVA